MSKIFAFWFYVQIEDISVQGREIVVFWYSNICSWTCLIPSKSMHWSLISQLKVWTVCTKNTMLKCVLLYGYGPQFNLCVQSLNQQETPWSSICASIWANMGISNQARTSVQAIDSLRTMRRVSFIPVLHVWATSSPRTFWHVPLARVLKAIGRLYHPPPRNCWQLEQFSSHSWRCMSLHGKQQKERTSSDFLDCPLPALTCVDPPSTLDCYF